MSSTSVNLRVNNAEQFLESVSEPSPNTRIYLSIGRVLPWSNESSPDIANTSIASVYEIWNNMIGAKRITGNDMRHVIPKYNWVANTKYIAYDHMAENLHAANNMFYVLTSDQHVYKCLANNYSANSTIEPTAVNPEAISSTSDGYIWKYMYSLSGSDLYKFTTSNYIPVRTLSTDDGSTQWDVQDSAVDGGIHSIIVTNGGSGYTNVDNLVITIVGDGSSATATGQINTVSNVVSNVTITDAGSEYSNAIVRITGGGGSGALARAIISPPGGHGSDPLYELGGYSVLIDARVNNSETDVLPVTNDYRQIALIKDPIIRGTANVSQNIAVLQAYSVTTTGSGEYIQDEYVYQGSSLSAASFSARVLESDAANTRLILTNITGSPTAGALIGANSTVNRFITSTTEGYLKPYSGKILYIDNIKAITRASDQSENFKILLKF